MAAPYEYWVISLPQGQRKRGEDVLAAMNRELSELAERGWDVVGFDRSNSIGPATFVLRTSRG
jgi:hypothetical protein